MAPMIRSPTGSWLAAASSRSQIASPTPDDTQINGDRGAFPIPNGRASQHDKKRLSLAFLTKEFLMGEPEKEKETKAEKPPVDDDASTTVSSRSRSKDTHSRNRLSLNFLNHTTSGSSQPEALPSFPPHALSNHSESTLQRNPSQKRPETIKSQKSDKSLGSRTGSMKKRLSFMNISKKSSKSSVRGRVDDTLVEE
jgi:dedicator of cytokinesis protein 3